MSWFFIFWGLFSVGELVSAAHPDASVEVWCQDEARLGLMSVIRRVWEPVSHSGV